MDGILEEVVQVLKVASSLTVEI
jgi:hypothetical protein